MELGNIAFGHSRGEFPVPREWEDGFYRLIDILSDEGRTSIEFENDVFAAFPYYWGDCSCGYEERESNWTENNKHLDTCYQVELDKAWEIWLTENPEPQRPWGSPHKSSLSALQWEKENREWYNKKMAWQSQQYAELCRKYNLPLQGCAVHCTCNYKERRADFLAREYHTEECPIIRPNFLHKPSGFSLMWYKYPLRDSYTNQRIDQKRFEEIVQECIKSIGGKMNRITAIQHPELINRTVENLCPNGHKFVIKRNRKDEGLFLGCSAYPQCKETSEIPQDLIMRLTGSEEMPGV